MIGVALVIASLLVVVGLVTYSRRRVSAGRGATERETWERVAHELGARVGGTEGVHGVLQGLQMSGQRDAVQWELLSAPAEAMHEHAAVLLARFESIDRLGIATLFRDLSIREGQDFRGNELRALYRIEVRSVPAGCIVWMEDPEVQELVLALAAPLVSTEPVGGATAVSILLSDVDVEAVHLALECASRLARLARDGIAATPPH